MPTVSITRECFYHLNAIGKINSKFSQVQNLKKKELDDSNVFFFIRPNDCLSVKIARHAKKQGRLVVTLFDDDLLNIPDNVPLAPWRKKNIEKILKLTDVLVSSSEHILQKYKDRFLIKRIAKIDTIVREDEFSKCEYDDHEQIRLVYAAGPKHVGLFNQFILPVLPMLCDRYGKRLSLTCIGLYPEIQQFADKIDVKIVSSMPLLEYRKYMQKQRFDIGLAPLVTNDFTKCKYYNKFLEYTTANIVGVYSKTEPYTYVIDDGINGFLAEDSVDSWYEKLCYAIDNADSRKKCLKNAIRWIKDNNSVESISDRLIEDIPEMIKSDYGEVKMPSFQGEKIIYRCYRIFDYLYLSLFYLKEGGIKSFVKNALVHLKEHYK